jgi:hypothetical protein
MTYNVSIGNWTNYTNDAVGYQAVGNYIIGSNGGSDPAYGCYKNFTSNYQCGNGPMKSLTIGGSNNEAGGQSAQFDCSQENQICAGFKLTVGDDGNLTLTNSTGNTVWTSNTFSVGVPLDQYKASNSRYGRNYLMSGEILQSGEFVGSPSGNCYLMMVENSSDSTQNGLQLIYNIYNCNMGNDPIYGLDTSAGGLYSIPITNISNVGKVAYIDENKQLHEYTSDMISQGTTYSFIGNYDSPGNDISQIPNVSLEQCVAECNITDGCNGFVLYGGACNLKNTNVYPNSLRTPNKDLKLYIRDKNVNNNSSCSNQIVTDYASIWDTLPVSSNMTMDTLCGLGAYNNTEMNNATNDFYNIANTMQNTLNATTQNSNDINDAFINSENTLNANIKEYTKTYNRIRKNNETLDNLTAMADDTKINRTSQNIKYFVWANLAIVITIFTIKFLRKKAV